MELQTIFTSVRPARVAIFIDSADPDWQHTAARIIEFLATLWGGQYSLIVPSDGTSISPKFWAILSSFDPDYLFYYQKTLADMKAATPNDYEARLQEEVGRFQAQNGSSTGDRVRIDEQLSKVHVSSFGISPSLSDELSRRIVPFSLHGGKIGFITAGVSAFWPLTGIAGMLRYYQHVSTAACIETNLPTVPPIWHAASLGLQHEAHSGALSGVGLRPLTIRCDADHVTALFQLVMLGKDEFWHLPPSEYPSEDRQFPFRLTMANLSTYQSTDAAFAMEPLMIIGLVPFFETNG